MKTILKNLIKLSLVAGLFYLLSQNGAISLSATQGALKRVDRMLLGLGLGLVCSLLGVARWRLLLKAQNIRLSFWRVFQLTYVGNFFNIALPGAVSGDFVKAFYVAKESQGRPSLAFGSILLDRVVGLSALVCVSAVSLAIGYEEFTVGHVFDALGLFLKISASLVVVFYAYIFLVKENHDPILKLLNRIEVKLKFIASIKRIYLAIRAYHDSKGALLGALGISVVIHLLVGLQLMNFLAAFDESLNPLQLYAVFPMGFLVTAIPVAPAGVGTGHAAFAYLLGLFGSKRGADLFSLFAIVQLVIGALGGLIYLQFRSKNGTHQASDVVA